MIRMVLSPGGLFPDLPLWLNMVILFGFIILAATLIMAVTWLVTEGHSDLHVWRQQRAIDRRNDNRT